MKTLVENENFKLISVLKITVTQIALHKADGLKMTLSSFLWEKTLEKFESLAGIICSSDLSTANLNLIKSFLTDSFKVHKLHMYKRCWGDVMHLMTHFFPTFCYNFKYFTFCLTWKPKRPCACLSHKQQQCQPPVSQTANHSNQLSI